MVSVHALKWVDRQLNPSRVKQKTKIGICCFSTKHAAVSSNSKDWLAWNQDNVSDWSDMSIC